MLEAGIHEEALATLNRLQEKHSNLKDRINKAYGYAVFPSIGRASVVLGGAHGLGEVFEQGEPIGFASMSQITVGVQVGGQTFSEVLLFNDKPALDKFKTRGRLGLTFNASAVIVKAAATATNNVSDIETKTYSQGGMLLEASMGGSKYSFIPPLKNKPGLESRKGDTAAEQTNVPGNDSHKEKQHVSDEQKEKQSQIQSAKPGNPVLNGIKKIHSLTKLIPHNGKSMKSTIGMISEKTSGIVSGAHKELETNRILHKDVKAALVWIEEQYPQFKKAIDQAYGYAVFPSVGRAGLVLGGAYGKGEVFEQNKLVGYAGIIQVTIGVQVGGETFTAAVLFDDKSGLERFKQGKTGFAASAAAVIIKAGAETANSYQSDKVYIFSEGGLLIDAAIGGQKVIFKPAVLKRDQRLDVHT
jgi:lipid-binding SYLF domain-containing protein